MATAMEGVTSDSNDSNGQHNGKAMATTGMDGAMATTMDGTTATEMEDTTAMAMNGTRAMQRQQQQRNGNNGNGNGRHNGDAMAMMATAMTAMDGATATQWQRLQWTARRQWQWTEQALQKSPCAYRDYVSLHSPYVNGDLHHPRMYTGSDLGPCMHTRIVCIAIPVRKRGSPSSPHAYRE